MFPGIKSCYKFIASILFLALVVPSAISCRAFDIPVIRDSKDILTRNGIASHWLNIGRKVQPSIVRVQLDNAFYSGVIIDNKARLVLTTFLVGGENDPVTIILSDKSEYIGEVLKVDYDLNLAVVGMTDSQNVAVLPELKEGDSAALKEGDAVAIAMSGYQGDFNSSQTADGKIENISEDGLISVSIPFDMDKLGGALINTRGEVIGILIGSIEIGEDADGLLVVEIGKAKPLISQTVRTP